MAARSYIVTSSRRLDAYLARGAELSRLELRVGQLSGKPRYPAGYRSGKVYADPQPRMAAGERSRRELIRSMRKQLAGMDSVSRRAAMRDIKVAFRASGISSKGLSKRRAGQGTQVAKVAGVLHAGTAFHVRALDAHLSHIRAECEAIAVVLHAGGSPVQIIRGIGRGARDAVRASIQAEGHVATGRMLRTTQYEIIDGASRAWHQRVSKARRVAARAQRARKR